MYSPCNDLHGSMKCASHSHFQIPPLHFLARFKTGRPIAQRSVKSIDIYNGYVWRRENTITKDYHQIFTLPVFCPFHNLSLRPNHCHPSLTFISMAINISASIFPTNLNSFFNFKLFCSKWSKIGGAKA